VHDGKRLYLGKLWATNVTLGLQVLSMKRFLVFFILIVFLVVSCAGPNRVGWTKPDYRQGQFEKDRKECIHSIDKYLDSKTFGKALDECLKFTKPDFRQDQFEREKDRKECIDSIQSYLDPETFGKALDECLQKKGYEYQASQDKAPPSEGMKVLKTVGAIVFLPVLAVVWVVVFLGTGGRTK
jgi:hypothetical protein